MWTDIWTGEAPLSTLFPTIFASITNKEVSVSQCWSSNGWRWRFICRGFAMRQPDTNRTQVALLKDLLLRSCPTNRPDLPRWRWTPDQSFSVKSLYSFIDNTGLKDLVFHHLWTLNIPTKTKVFVWILLRKRLPTADRLSLRGMQIANHCNYCASAVESCNHLFAKCIFTRFLLFMARVPLVDDNDCVRALWTATSSNTCSARRSKALTSLAAIWWVVWTERNNLIFGTKSPDANRALDRVLLLSSMWSDPPASPSAHQLP